MRLLVAIAMALLVVASVFLFLSAANRRLIRASTDYPTTRSPAHGVFDVDVTLTFDAQADEFLADDPTSLLVKLGETQVISRPEPVAAGSPVSATGIRGIVEGKNEFYVQVLPSENTEARWNAVRIRILRDGRSIAEQTLWGAPGDPVIGNLVVDVPKQYEDEPAHNH